MGINCHFDPETCVKTVKMMKEGVEKAGLKAHYMCQPLAYHTPDCNCQGFIDLPEFPFSMYTPTFNPSIQMLTRKTIIHSCTTVCFSVRSGAEDPDQMGHAEIRPGSVQRWHSLHRRLLWI